MNPEDQNKIQDPQAPVPTPAPPNEPDLTDVDVMTNGQMMNLAEPEDTPEEPPASEGEPNNVQADLDDAKASMSNAKTTLTEKGVDYDALEAEYNEKGELSAESYETLKNAGYPKEIVDAVIAGWEAKAGNFFDAVVDNAGGSEEYNKIQQFVVGQGEGAIKAFNSIMEQGDLNICNSYIAGIKAQMVAKYGTSNPTLTGSGVTNAVQGFADQTEMVKAMSDRRYGRDANYTKEIETRVALSKFFG